MATNHFQVRAQHFLYTVMMMMMIPGPTASLNAPKSLATSEETEGYKTQHSRRGLLKFMTPCSVAVGY